MLKPLLVSEDGALAHTAFPAPPIVQIAELHVIWLPWEGKPAAVRGNLWPQDEGLWKPHPDSPPTYEPTSWGSKFTAVPVSLQTDFSPAALGCACLAISACQDWHWCLGSPSLLPPERAHERGRFWLLAPRVLLWTAHKAIAFQFCPEREKNSFLRLEHHILRPDMLCSAFRERRFLIFSCICCH